MSLFQTIACLFFLIISLSADHLNVDLNDLEKEYEKQKWNANLFSKEALNMKPLKDFYSDFHSFVETIISGEMKYLDENIPFNFDSNRDVYSSAKNLEEFKEKGNRFYGKVLFAIKWINKGIDFVSKDEQLKEHYDRDLKYLSFIKYYLEKAKLRFENHWKSIFDQIEKIEKIEKNEKFEEIEYEYAKIAYYLKLQFENKDYIESMKRASETTDDLINDRNYCLVTELISSEKIDFLNGADPELKELLSEHEDSTFYENASKKKSLTDSYHRFDSFLYYRIKSNLKLMKTNFPYKVDLNTLFLKQISDKVASDFKINANGVYNRILFAIQWNNERIDFLSKDAKLKDFYKQDLIYLSMIKQNLNRCRELFIEHLEKLFSKVEAYKQNKDEEKQITFLREVDKEINNEKFEFYLGRASYIAESMQKKESKLLNSEWMLDIEPGLEKSLATFVENNDAFIQDFDNRKTLEKHYKELLVFLEETRKIMDKIKDNIPFDIKGSKLLMNGKEQTFKRIANQCFQRLRYAELWVNDRHRQLSFFNQESVDETYKVGLTYPNDQDYLHKIGDDVSQASHYLHHYIGSIYDQIAAYKKNEGSLLSPLRNMKIIPSLERISRKRYFIGKTNDGIKGVTRLIKKVSAGKETFEDDSENEKYDDNVPEEINPPTERFAWIS